MNPQLFKNHPIAGSSVHEEWLSSEDKLFNPKDPNLGVLHEKPEHRIIILLKATGLSNREIARRTGYTEPWVGQVLRQPWARLELVKQINAAGRDEVFGLLQSAAVDSVYTLIELNDGAGDVTPAVRKSAADSILDRVLGKPTQRIEAQSDVNVTINNIAEVDRQIEELEREENRLLGRN